MNGSNPIFPLAGTGQTTSVQTVQAPESEKSAFADNLAAALAASSLIPVLPKPPEAETPTASFDVSLATGSHDTAVSTPDGTVSTGDGRNAGVPISIADAGIGAIAGSAMRSEDGSSAGNLRTDDLVNALGRSEPASVFGGAPVDAEVTDQKPPVVTAADIPDVPAARHAGAVSVDAVAGRALDPSRQMPDTGVQPAIEAPLDSKTGQPMILSSRREAASVREPSELSMHALKEGAPRAVPNGVPSSKSPLANQPLGEDPRPTTPVSALAREDKAETTLSSPPAASVQAIAHHATAHENRLDTPRRTIDAPAETIAQQAVSRNAANGPDSALPAVRSQAGEHKAEAVDPVMRSFTPTANPMGPSDDRPTTRKRDTTPVIINETLGKSGLNVLPGNTPQVSSPEAILRTSSDFGGFDRLQPVPQADGAALDTARFEASLSLAQLKTQTPVAPAPAGAQIALQIVRSLPEGIQRFSLHLQPAELGSVDIQLNFESGGKLSALIVAERPETLELLQRDGRILERSLGDSGLKLSSDGLSFTLKQDQQQQQQGQSFQEQAHAREAAFRAGRAYDGASDAEPAPPIQRIDRLRLLDIRT